MKLAAKTQNLIVEIIALLYVLLFVYAAVSKILDFENFQVQLGQSPLLSAFAHWVAFGTPFLELFIVLLLVFPKCRLTGLYAAFSLMVLFSTYIVVILNFSSFVPCSCGGILENMSWTQHLVFNIFFVVLAIVGIYMLTAFETDPSSTKMNRLWIVISALFVGSVAIVMLLFVTSEEIIHHRNPFVRRFIPHRINKQHQEDLGYNSYYFAGTGKGTIYLGNYTDPSRITVLDSTLKNRKQYTIQLDNVNFPFRSIQVKVVPPYFYVLDGTVPCIFKGAIGNWKANLIRYRNIHFSAAAIMHNDVIAIRTRDTQKRENTLGVIQFGNPAKVQLAPKLLQKQIDGVFDTDGSLHYSQALQKLVYVYYYRNQFIVSDPHLKLIYRGKTIDTNSVAKLKIAYLPERGIKQFSAPPFTVNVSSSVFNNLLFVHSNLEGKFESQKMWEQASVVDVYDIVENSYQFSFYVYHHNRQKMRSFVVTDSHLFALIDNQIVAYSLGDLFKNKSRNSQ
ncbi:MauE/DoxX family redox-associated membrane protein [Flavobacterium limnophilum]|uniref:MauE/DoxX family redox-associated membrane protein n=1 Tax=Flavobacterium limnophilum TaxID=3003262 RepID=UPI0022ABC8DA|nr:MauE/DoxX family redox-associated membrane protein [Flavobacterium limnophilum]